MSQIGHFVLELRPARHTQSSNLDGLFVKFLLSAINGPQASKAVKLVS